MEEFEQLDRRGNTFLRGFSCAGDIRCLLFRNRGWRKDRVRRASNIPGCEALEWVAWWWGCVTTMSQEELTSPVIISEQMWSWVGKRGLEVSSKLRF